MNIGEKRKKRMRARSGARWEESNAEEGRGWGEPRRPEGKNVWAQTWECDRKSEKEWGAENKLGTFLLQCHWREAFHCHNHNSRLSNGAITSAGGNFSIGDLFGVLKVTHKERLSRVGGGSYAHILIGSTEGMYIQLKISITYNHSGREKQHRPTS